MLTQPDRGEVIITSPRYGVRQRGRLPYPTREKGIAAVTDQKPLLPEASAKPKAKRRQRDNDPVVAATRRLMRFLLTDAERWIMAGKPERAVPLYEKALSESRALAAHLASRK